MRLRRYPEFHQDAEGKPLCRGCGAPVPQGRQTWCSNECYRILCPQAVKRQAILRDKGVCARCGVDAKALRREYRGLVEDRGCAAARVEYLRRHPENPFPLVYGRKWFEMDHIIEFAAGGSHLLANMQTLCIPCHKVKTTAFAKRPRHALQPA
jgi:5-methylcytosine-specific restriction endonuclease McrA